MVKIKAIVVGGDAIRNRSAFGKLEKFLEIHHIDQNKVLKPTQIGDAQVIIVITRFSSVESKNAVKSLKGKKNNLGQQVEIVNALTPNHVLEEMKKFRQYATFFKEEKVKTPVPATTEVVETVVEAAPVSVSETPVTLGLSPEDLWTQYGSKVAEFARQAMKPGEKLREIPLVELISSLVGIPQQDVRTVLPQLALRGILTNTVADTWKAPIPNDTDESREPDLEPALVEEPAPVEEPEKPKKKRDHIFGLIRIIAGLSTGPYKTIRDIARMARRCPDFRGLDGKEISPGYGDVICSQARALGVIEKDGDQWKINVDSTVKITLVQEKPQKIKAAVTPRDSFEERLARVIDAEKKEPGAPRKAGPRVISTSDAVRDSYDGLGITTFGTWRGAMEIFKELLPDKYWDEMAALTISRKLKSGTPEAQLQYKHEFKVEEWNALAWEALRKLPVDTFSMLLRKPDRETMTCPDCKEVIPVPKRCSACHKKRFVNRIKI